MKRVLAVLASAGVVVITLLGAGRLWVLASLPALGGREPVPGLGDSVVILWDSLAVPHIVASSDSDLFAAVGYLHARDRLWQMDLLRHAAEGRLAELFGARALPDDRRLRQLELPGIAAARSAGTGAESRRAAAAYARGVNAWLAAGRRAVEFRILGHTPEPWQPIHTFEVGLLQAWDLRTTGDELQLAEVAARLGIERARELLPEPVPGEPLILGRASPAGPLELAPAGPASASNAWVVAGRRTASGKPILANDPHLTLRAPSVWYLLGAHAPGYDVVGATIPGAPVVVLGHTARLGWGFTNAMVDDVDYVVVELSADSSRYRTEAGWAPVETVAETIRVRGAEPVTFIRRRAGDRPLVTTSPWDPGPGRAVALRWTAQDARSDEIGALLGMARAADWRAFRTALLGFRTPEQNVVYADTAGNIAYWLAGRVPVRRGGPPWLPAPAWTGEGAWVRDLEPAALPQTRNPARGWIVTANNRQTGAGYPHFLSRHYDLAYRAARIAELVQADSPATVASTSRHQMDIRDGFARRHRALAARAAQALGRADLADRLRAWPGDMRVDAVEPAVFWSWYRELERLIYEDQSPYYRPAWALDRWMAGEEGGGAGSGDPWIDDVRTPERETLDSLARRAMTAVIGARAPGPWGRLHRIVMNHPLAGVPVLGRWLGFRVGPLEAPGSNYTVNNARSPAEGPPFTSEWGPSLRHVVDFGNVDGAGGFILPTGQSGHPLSRHYRNQTERWRRGELWIIPVDVGRVRTVDTLLLVRGGAMSQRGSPPGARRLMGTKKTPQGFPWGASLARHRAP